MWPKQDDAVGLKQPVGVKQPKDAVEMGDPPVTMAMYTDAMNAFSKNATALIEQIPLFIKARDSYEQAMTASAELRKILDDGDEKLRTLMADLQQGVSVQVEKPTADKKKPEPAKVETTRKVDTTKAERRPFAVNELPYPKWSDLP